MPAFALAIALACAWGVVYPWNGKAEKRVRVVVPGRLVRGAWQDPDSLRAIIARERIKTIVTLTAINRDDPKYPGQAQVVAETGVGWVIVPMRGSRRRSNRWPRPPTCWPIRAGSRFFSIAWPVITAPVWRMRHT